jgi:hypothetical protein
MQKDTWLRAIISLAGYTLVAVTSPRGMRPGCADQELSGTAEPLLVAIPITGAHTPCWRGPARPMSGPEIRAELGALRGYSWLY